MDFCTYKFRCSALGKIISKSGKITDQNKNYLQELFIGAVYGIRKEISSKYFEKGKYCEEDGITMLNSCLYPGELLIKNKERRENEWIQGEDDCFHRGIVWDIKNAYDLFSFGKAELTWDYQWQLYGYSWLRNTDNCGLFYCINNMPEHLLQSEERKIFYQGNFVTTENQEYERLCSEMREKHNYDKMPLFERFKFWDLHFEKEHKKRIIEAVHYSRLYLADLWEEHGNLIVKNKKRMGIL